MPPGTIFQKIKKLLQDFLQCVSAIVKSLTFLSVRIVKHLFVCHAKSENSTYAAANADIHFQKNLKNENGAKRLRFLCLQLLQSVYDLPVHIQGTDAKNCFVFSIRFADCPFQCLFWGICVLCANSKRTKFSRVIFTF